MHNLKLVDSEYKSEPDTKDKLKNSDKMGTLFRFKNLSFELYL